MRRVAEQSDARAPALEIRRPCRPCRTAAAARRAAAAARRATHHPRASVAPFAYHASIAKRALHGRVSIAGEALASQASFASIFGKDDPQWLPVVSRVARDVFRPRVAEQLRDRSVPARGYG